MKTTRNITIEPMHSLDNPNNPKHGAKLRLKGIWLRELGFCPGKSVKVETQWSSLTNSYQLVITPNK